MIEHTNGSLDNSMEHFTNHGPRQAYIECCIGLSSDLLVCLIVQSTVLQWRLKVLYHTYYVMGCGYVVCWPCHGSTSACMGSKAILVLHLNHISSGCG